MDTLESNMAQSTQEVKPIKDHTTLPVQPEITLKCSIGGVEMILKK